VKIAQLAPLLPKGAEAIEIRPGCRYILRIRRRLTPEDAERIEHYLRGKQLDCIVISEDVDIFELFPQKES
jgi:hypothetical protein